MAKNNEDDLSAIHLIREQQNKSLNIEERLIKLENYNTIDASILKTLKEYAPVQQEIKTIIFSKWTKFLVWIVSILTLVFGTFLGSILVKIFLK
jgi:hypothetical protein